MKLGTLKILKWIILFLFLIFCLFICSQSAGAKSISDFHYLILVDLKNLNLSLKDLQRGVIIKKYPIAGPRSLKYLEPLPKIGEIGKIEFHPFWYPTPNTRESYFKKYGVELPTVIHPNDPRNAMGTVAMVLKFDGKQSIYRLHGTNEPQSIGKRASSGCIRMKNEDIEELARTIFNFKTKIIIYYEKIPVE